MREIIFSDKHIENLMRENQENQKKIDAALDEMERLQKDVDKLALKKQQVRDKMYKPVSDMVKKKTTLGEFEIITAVKKHSAGVVVEIEDQLEIYKSTLRNRKYEKSGVQQIKDDDVKGKDKK
jgi:hypothetical protein